MAVIRGESGTIRYERGDIDLGPLAEALREAGLDALSIRDMTGVALPKVLRLMGITQDVRRGTELTGYEVAQLSVLAGVPLSSIVKVEGGLR